MVMPRGLTTRHPALAAVAREAVRGAYRAILKLWSSDGTIQAQGSGDVVEQQEGLTRVGHYGLVSRPPADTEVVIVPCEAGDAAVADVTAIPSFFSSASAGEAALHDSDAYVWCRSGSVEVEPKSGSKIKLGKNATKAVALLEDPCGANASMLTWMSQVEGYINGLVPGTVAPLSSTFAGSGLAGVKASATKATAE